MARTRGSSANATAMGVTTWLRASRKAFLLDHGFYHFCKESYIIPDIMAEPHEEMCAEMESCVPDMLVGRRQRRKLYLAPRYTYKTSLVIALIVYLLLKYPDIAILVIRATRESAQQILFEVKGIFQTNATIIDVFGDLSKNAPLWSESRIVLPTRTRPNKDPSVMAAGIDVSTTGMHPDAVFADDIVTRENCDSPRLMLLARAALQAIYPLLPPWGTMLVTGTRWSNIDAYGWVLARNREQIDRGESPSYDVYIRAAIMTNEDGTTRLFFPSKLTMEFLEQQRADLEPRYFASWYYNQTYEEGLKPFTNLQFFSGEYQSGPYHHVAFDPSENAPEERLPLYMVQIVDPALTASASSDSFGVVVLGFDRKGDWWVFEGYEIRKLPSFAGDDLLSTMLAYEPDMLLVESANADVTMVARLQDAIRDNLLPTSVMSYSALQNERRGERGKAQRIGALEPLFRNGRIHIRRGACGELVRQLDGYPSLVHDDVIDALAMGRSAQARAPLPDLIATTVGEERPDAWHEAIGWKKPNAPRDRTTSGSYAGMGSPR